MSKSIRIILGDFRIQALSDGAVVREITDMSCGRDGHRTPLFPSASLKPRERLHISSKYPPPHGGAEMPFSLFFRIDGHDSGCAFHQGDTFASSHGCIHLNRTDAEWLFNWSGSDTVTVENPGPYPASPTRAHQYRLGEPHMLKRVIRHINERLVDLGLLGSPANDDFDARTETAVKAFQTEHGLKVDGVVGTGQTAPALGVKL